jgi:hypothetical protein
VRAKRTGPPWSEANLGVVLLQSALLAWLLIERLEAAEGGDRAAMSAFRRKMGGSSNASERWLQGNVRFGVSLT